MKVEVEKQETFKPIKLKVTIESEEEFCDLFHRLNAAVCNVNMNNFKLKYKATFDANNVLFNTLDDLLNNEYQYLKTK